MVLAKMNNYEHQSKPTYASYTFQVLMSFCEYLIKVLNKGGYFKFEQEHLVTVVYTLYIK